MTSKGAGLVPKDKQSLLFSATFSDEIASWPTRCATPKHPGHAQQHHGAAHHPGDPPRAVVRKSRCCCTSSSSTTGARCWCSPAPNWRQQCGRSSLTKNGVSAMALHGNKSQSARTQALAGFKTRRDPRPGGHRHCCPGIDIDELPRRELRDSQRVRGLRSPHRPHGPGGRHWRAVVSLVCMDEEGFMMDIERFTQAANPRPGHRRLWPRARRKAEPIAMGRQTSGAVQASHRAAK